MTFILKRTLFLLSAVHLPLLLVCLGLAPNTLINRGLIDGQDVFIQTITLDNLDITYIRTPEGWLFLAVVLDLFSRLVVGWSMQAAWIANSR